MPPAAVPVHPSRRPAGGRAAPPPAPAAHVAALVLAHARRTPGRAALVLPAPGAPGAVPAPAEVVTYAALAALVRGAARGVRAAGLAPGDRVLLLAPPSAAFYALALALMAGGLPVVLVDARAGSGPAARRRLLGALAAADARAVVAPAALLRWWPLVPALRHARRYAAGGWVPGTRPIAALLGEGAGDAATLPASAAAAGAPAADAPAIVAFTSGTDGRARPVVRTHGVLLAQHRALAAAFPPDGDAVHLTTLPLIALHALCCGATAVLCRPDAPAAGVLALARRHGATGLSGAPAFVDRLAAHALAAGDGAPTVARLLVGGGPASRALCGRVRRAFPGAVGHVVYGATEAEPIATVPMREVEASEGRGYLVGRPVPGVRVALRAPGAVDASADASADAAEGEVLVRGAHVVGAADADGAAWHRTGDLARRDARGRLWLLGRAAAAVAHHGRALHPYAVEAALLDDPALAAAALVAHARAPHGVVAVVPAAGVAASAALAAARARLDAMALATLPVHALPALPMDARHGSKVRRDALAAQLERAAR